MKTRRLSTQETIGTRNRGCCNTVPIDTKQPEASCCATAYHAEKTPQSIGGCC